MPFEYKDFINFNNSKPFFNKHTKFILNQKDILK